MCQVGPVLLVDAPEEQGPWAVRQQRHPAGECGDVVEVGVPGGDQVPEQALGPLPHGGERLQGVVQVGLFGRELGVRRGSGHAHRRPDEPFTPEKTDAQKSPDIPGTITHFSPLRQAL